MGWLCRLNQLVGAVIFGAQWLALPLILLLFLQWPMRDVVRAYSREANDLGQWIFALYVSLAMTFATRERAHLAVDAIAHGYSQRLRRAIARWGGFACVAPWALFMIWTIGPTVQRSVLSLEKFPDTYNPGYFLVKFAALLLAVLALVQALIDVLRPAKD